MIIKWRRNFRKVITVVALFAVFIYFMHALFSGNRNVLNMYALDQELLSLEGELTVLSVQKEELERNVKNLHPNHLNAETLEEQAKRVLGYLHKDEYVIPLPEEN